MDAHVAGELQERLRIQLDTGSSSGVHNLQVRRHCEVRAHHEVPDAAASLATVQELHATSGKEFHHLDDSAGGNAAASASASAGADTAIAGCGSYGALTVLCCSIATATVDFMKLDDLNTAAVDSAGHRQIVMGVDTTTADDAANFPQVLEDILAFKQVYKPIGVGSLDHYFG